MRDDGFKSLAKTLGERNRELEKFLDACAEVVGADLYTVRGGEYDGWKVFHAQYQHLPALLKERIEQLTKS